MVGNPVNCDKAKTGCKACKNVPARKQLVYRGYVGAFSSSTMMVMMTAITPSLKASSRAVPMTLPDSGALLSVGWVDDWFEDALKATFVLRLEMEFLGFFGITRIFKKVGRVSDAGVLPAICPLVRSSAKRAIWFEPMSCWAWRLLARWLM